MTPSQSLEAADHLSRVLQWLEAARPRVEGSRREHTLGLLAQYISNQEFGEDVEAPHALVYLMQATDPSVAANAVIESWMQESADQKASEPGCTILRWAASVSLTPEDLTYLLPPYECPSLEVPLPGHCATCPFGCVLGLH